MSEKPGVAKDSLVGTIIALLATLVVFASDAGALFKHLTPPEPAWATKIHAQLKAQSLRAITVFDAGDQIKERMADCDYQYLVVCRTLESECAAAGETSLALRACVAGRSAGVADTAATHSSPATFVLALVVGSAKTLARFPDAAADMLGHRWAQGPIDFWAGVVFVLVYISLIVGSLRLPAPARPLAFFIAVLFGLELTGGLFWLLATALAGAGDLAVDLAATVVSGLFMLTCLLICIQHDLSRIAEDGARILHSILRLIGRTPRVG